MAYPSLRGLIGPVFRRNLGGSSRGRQFRFRAFRQDPLSVEGLERRELLAAENLLAPDIAVYSNQLQPLQQPPVIASQNGVLEASVRLVSAGTDSNPILYGTEELFTGTAADDATGQRIAAMAYQFDAYGESYPASFPGATLQLEPGDTLKLTVTNDLSTNLDANELATNFHFHGGHVPTMGQGDNVYRSLGPGETMEVVIPVPAESQSAGMNWYHPHHHMSTHVQVYGGLVGTTQIGDTLDAWPQYKGAFEELTLTFSEVNIHDGKLRALATSDGFMTGWQKRVNGQLNPKMTMRPGETQIWNLANIGSRGLFNLALTDEDLGSPWQATILAVDGNETDMRPLPLELSADPLRMQNALAPTAIPGGGRVAMAVTAPTEPGTYYLIDGWGGDEFSGRFGTNVIQGNTSTEDISFEDIANFWNSTPPEQGYFLLATIEVTGNPVDQPPPVFPGQPPSPMFTTQADVTREIRFTPFGDTPLEQIPNLLSDIFGIDGERFGDTITPIVEIGTVEEWTIRNETIISHSFHIHQGKFTVVAVNGRDVDPYAPPGTSEQTYISELDVVMVPPGESVTIRFGVENFPGNYVFHCHILPHEDQGMMATVRAVSPTAGLRTPVSDRAVSESPAMRIIDGRSHSFAVAEPFADLGYSGTLATASTFDRAALVQTVAVGTGEGRSLVRLYEDIEAAVTTEFVAFDNDAGVSLAIGSISVDGSAVVAVGSRASGARVRLFDTDGTLLREFTDVLEGDFPNGVNVTAQDVNGDNFADLIVSGRAGGQPLVKAIDGEDIATGVENPATFFTFAAGGGDTAGAKVALAYNDVPTSGTYMPKIMTTPEQGELAGTVQVWDTSDFIPPHSHDFPGHGAVEGSGDSPSMPGMPHGGMAGMMDSGTGSDGDTTPTPIVEFQPFGGAGGAVELTTSYLRQDGAPVLPVIINWQTDTEVAYTSISERGEATTTVLHYGVGFDEEATITRPAIRRAASFRLHVGPMGPSPITFDLGHLTGPVAAGMAGERFLINAAFGGTIDKWDGERWVDVMAPPTGGSPLELLRQLSFRLIGADDLLRWTPPAHAEEATSVFRIIGWDGTTISDPGHEVSFSIAEIIPMMGASETYSLSVPATADIFSPGHDAVPVTPNGGGTLPPFIELPSGVGRQIRFTDVTGSVSFNIDAAAPQDIYRGQYNGPDGGAVFWRDNKAGNPWPNAYTTDGTQPGRLSPLEKDTVTSFYLDMQAFGGVSGMVLFEPVPADRRVMFLTGVFTTADGPGERAPERLDFSSTSTSVPGGRSFTTLSPQIDQLFYVGDGLTGEGTGTQQVFVVPDEATHLYLGLIDGSRFIHGPDFFNNNDGSFSVELVVSSGPTHEML